mgnify:FL=1
MSNLQEERRFKIAIIGSGPGGYVAAIKAAQQGASVALIEARQLGGTCLNRGCIPTKALVASSSLFDKIQHAGDFGIEIEGARINYSRMRSRKDDIVSSIRSNLTTLIASNKIAMIQGWAKFATPHTLKIFDDNNEAQEVIRAEKIIIATGSEPLRIPAFPFDGEQVHSSTSLLDISEKPESIAIIGGGYIGCEFASIFSALGTKVTLIESTDRLINQGCPASSRALMEAFTARGIQLLCDHHVDRLEKNEQGVVLQIKNLKESTTTSIQSQICLVAIGRSFNSSNLNLEKALITLSLIHI